MVEAVCVPAYFDIRISITSSLPTRILCSNQRVESRHHFSEHKRQHQGMITAWKSFKQFDFSALKSVLEPIIKLGDVSNHHFDW